MLLNPDIDYSNSAQVIALLAKIDSTIKDIGMKRNFICKAVGDSIYTYSKFKAGVDGYVSEARIRKYCNYINERFEEEPDNI